MQTDITLKKEDKNDVSVIHVGGYLDAHTASKFESIIIELTKADRYKLILNFKGLDYISSAGLGVIMGNIEEIRNHGGDIKLSDMGEKIYRVFDLVGFPSLYDIFDTQKEAETAFESNK